MKTILFAALCAQLNAATIFSQLVWKDITSTVYLNGGEYKYEYSVKENSLTVMDGGKSFVSSFQIVSFDAPTYGRAFVDGNPNKVFVPASVPEPGVVCVSALSLILFSLKRKKQYGKERVTPRP